ncbi:hypothetical protein CH380_14725 [Leptospira adleri]|uniref:Uncharacterized protein n=1 Tax=Leptospira adleri TaxID=2023186 RepID=A0A2M9YLK6_9LEPT|nr:hypothetical protein CH380_14725 [Leptospira adleri]PJZ63595.1 hypothetical protein CH376_01745 [Leptospira adleri]
MPVKLRFVGTHTKNLNGFKRDDFFRFSRYWETLIEFEKIMSCDKMTAESLLLLPEISLEIRDFEP